MTKEILRTDAGLQDLLKPRSTVPFIGVEPDVEVVRTGVLWYGVEDTRHRYLLQDSQGAKAAVLVRKSPNNAFNDSVVVDAIAIREKERAVPLIRELMLVVAARHKHMILAMDISVDVQQVVKSLLGDSVQTAFGS